MAISIKSQQAITSVAFRLTRESMPIADTVIADENVDARIARQQASTVAGSPVSRR